jgi:hypothetical protein
VDTKSSQKYFDQVRATQNKSVVTGAVKWFTPTKEYGFIQPSGGKDIFVHISAVEQAEAHAQ